ncbi:MAG: 2'-5' RNA ligase family protein [Actinomycetes bacterium]
MTQGAGAELSARVLGVSIALPEPFESELTAVRERLGDPETRTVPTHITLLPPTTVDHVLLPEIHQHLAAAAAKTDPFRIRLRGSGTFRPVSPVVFVAVAEGIAPCEMLETRVRAGVLWRPVLFPYHPHVTVAHDLAPPALDAALEELAGYAADFTVDHFVLYEHVDGAWMSDRDFVFAG